MKEVVLEVGAKGVEEEVLWAEKGAKGEEERVLGEKVGAKGVKEEGVWEAEVKAKKLEEGVPEVEVGEKGVEEGVLGFEVEVNGWEEGVQREEKVEINGHQVKVATNDRGSKVQLDKQEDLNCLKNSGIFHIEQGTNDRKI